MIKLKEDLRKKILIASWKPKEKISEILESYKNVNDFDFINEFMHLYNRTKKGEHPDKPCSSIIDYLIFYKKLVVFENLKYTKKDVYNFCIRYDSLDPNDYYLLSAKLNNPLLKEARAEVFNFWHGAFKKSNSEKAADAATGAFYKIPVYKVKQFRKYHF